jgi:ABC-type glycerol-3-phosphate transport system substrate-binding protein
MKRILAIGMVVLLGFSVCAQNEKSELPPQLVQLKKGYEAKVKIAVEPIKREYKTALEKLIKQYGASGNIKFAVEVQKELDQYS